MNLRHYPLALADFKREIEPHIISAKNRSGRPSKVSHYKFFCAVLYVLRTGVSWRDLPSFYGSWHTIYTRFKRWSENGLFWCLLYQLQQKIKDYFRFCLDRQYDHQLASSWIRKFKKKGPQCIGRGRKGLSTKIHLGLSPGFVHGACLSEGQRVDMKVFSKLWSVGDWGDVLYVIADKGYDFYEVRKCLREAGKKPVIPRRKGAICPGVQDKERYQTRSNIERFFGKIKENKRLALRFDKLDVTFFSFFAIACLKSLNLLC